MLRQLCISNHIPLNLFDRSTQFNRILPIKTFKPFPPIIKIYNRCTVPMGQTDFRSTILQDQINKIHTIGIVCHLHVLNDDGRQVGVCWCQRKVDAFSNQRYQRAPCLLQALVVCTIKCTGGLWVTKLAVYLSTTNCTKYIGR